MDLEPVMELDRVAQIGSQLGRGGQATVFEIPADPDLVFKRYNQGLPVDAGALDSLIEWRVNLDEEDRAMLDAHSCWPRARVTEEGTTVGVVFRKAPEHFNVELASGNVRLRELQYLFLVERSRKIGVDVPGPLERVRIVEQLAELMSFLQDHDVVHGDLSMKNVLWAMPEGDVPAVFLLDCDGASVAGASAPLPQVTTPGWTDPRIISKEIRDPDTASDVYGLGLCFYRCYYGFLGEHDPTSTTLRLPTWPPVDEDLMTLTASTLSASSRRPSVTAWVDALSSLVNDLDDEETPLGAAYNDGQPTVEASPERPDPAELGTTPSATEGSAAPLLASALATERVPDSNSAPPESAPAEVSHLTKLLFAVSIGVLAGAIIALIVVQVVL